MNGWSSPKSIYLDLRISQIKFGGGIPTTRRVKPKAWQRVSSAVLRRLNSLQENRFHMVLSFLESFSCCCRIATRLDQSKSCECERPLGKDLPLDDQPPTGPTIHSHHVFTMFFHHVQVQKHRAVSLFSGVLGLELGLRQCSPKLWHLYILYIHQLSKSQSGARHVTCRAYARNLRSWWNWTKPTSTSSNFKLRLWKSCDLGGEKWVLQIRDPTADPRQLSRRWAHLRRHYGGSWRGTPPRYLWIRGWVPMSSLGPQPPIIAQCSCCHMSCPGHKSGWSSRRFEGRSFKSCVPRIPLVGRMHRHWTGSVSWNWLYLISVFAAISWEMFYNHMTWAFSTMMPAIVGFLVWCFLS